MELKKSWAKAWEMGSKAAKEYDSEDAALWAIDMDTLENFEHIHGFGAFFRTGFIGRKTEWVEAIRNIISV